MRGLSHRCGKILIDRAVPVETDFACDAVLPPLDQFVSADRRHVLVRDGYRITGILSTFVSRCQDPMDNDGRLDTCRCTMSRDRCCRTLRVQSGIEALRRHDYEVSEAGSISVLSVR